MGIKRVQSIVLIVAGLLVWGVPRTGKAAGNDIPKIHKGMTEAQVEKLYGEPDERSESDTGTTWTFTQIKSKAFIPFYGAFSHGIKVIIVTFRHGRVVSYEVQSS